MPRLSYDPRNCKVMCNAVLLGSYLSVAAVFILLLANGKAGSPHTLDLLALCSLALLYLLATHILAHVLHYNGVVPYLIILFYALLAASIVWERGVDAPIATLTFVLVIALAGILLSARHALFAALLVGSVLAAAQIAVIFNWHVPDSSWRVSASNFGDVLAYCMVFSMLALVSWLYNREIGQSLFRAKQADAALVEQKATLNLRVEERTTELRQVQLEEMQQMYRFSELGQLGIVLLHDLANHLTALILEVEGIQSKQHSEDITRARMIIGHLENIVKNTRERLNGDTQNLQFDVVRKTSDALDFLSYKAVKAGVTIDWQPPAHAWKYMGDPTCYCQVIAILASNAIDAYGPSGRVAEERKVVVALERSKTHIIATISDWGKGISKKEREQLFKPHHSSKKSGLGLGLYIAKQTIEMQFSGKLLVNHRGEHTEFVIRLPLKRTPNS